MNYALYALQRLSASLKTVARVLLAPPTPVRSAVLPAQRPHTSPEPFPFQTRGQPNCAAPAKPLRVLRVMEPGQQRACVGRMVISGRMVDVCAELDRLAAREAAML